jgi:hypothetical protein
LGYVSRFVGFMVYIAAWVFMFPAMLAICAGAGVVRTWLEARSAREETGEVGASSPVEQRVDRLFVEHDVGSLVPDPIAWRRGLRMSQVAAGDARREVVGAE